MKKRVVITGLGVVSAVGLSVEEFWDSIKKGKTGISKVERFSTKDYQSDYGGEIKNFNFRNCSFYKKEECLGRATQFALAATDMALKTSKITINNYFRKNACVVLGTTMGEGQEIEELDRHIVSGECWTDYKDVYNRFPAFNMNNTICKKIGITGESILLPNACAAGNFAIGYAYDLISMGKRQFALAGGADPLSEVAFKGFSRLRSMSNDLCRPFDLNRKGMMIGEGAGILLLEELEHAIDRNADIYAEVLGYGVSCDAFHMVTPDPEARGIQLAMQKAIRNAGITCQDIDYISAHGTGTPANDRAETLAMKAIFRDKYKEIPISSIKSMLGHSMGAASGIEAVACCMALKEGIVPPTINFETADPMCDIDCVPNVARKKKLNIVANNAYAFGGNNTCLILKKYV